MVSVGLGGLPLHIRPQQSTNPHRSGVIDVIKRIESLDFARLVVRPLIAITHSSLMI